MPGLAMPAFFGDSFRMSRTSVIKDDPNSSAYGVASMGLSEIPLDDNNDGPAASAAQSMTPFQPHQPELVPEDRRRRHVSVTTRLPPTTGPVALAAETVIKAGSLKKRSKNLSGALWQQRYVVLEGAPTHVLVYYYAAAERSENAQKPRGVVSLNEVKVEPYGKEGLAFRVHAPKRTYEFRAPSTDDASAWIQSINQAVEETRTGASHKSAPVRASVESVDNDDVADELVGRAQLSNHQRSGGGSVTSTASGYEDLAIAAGDSAAQGSGDGEKRTKFGLGQRLGNLGFRRKDNNRQAYKPSPQPQMQALNSWTDLGAASSGRSTSFDDLEDQRRQRAQQPARSTNGSTRLEEMAGEEYERPTMSPNQSADI